MDDVRLIPPVVAVSFDNVEWVEDLDIPLDPGMTVDDSEEEVDSVWLDLVSNGFDVDVLCASLCRRIAGMSRV
jgi:hypothetical protein